MVIRLRYIDFFCGEIAQIRYTLSGPYARILAAVIYDIANRVANSVANSVANEVAGKHGKRQSNCLSS